MTSPLTVRFATLVLGLGLFANLTGCSGSGGKAEVSGTIKLRGKAPGFHGLQIVFMSEEGTLTSADINEDGTYKADAVPTGDVKICFAYATPEAVKQGAEFQSNGGRKLTKPGEKKGPAPKPKLNGKEPAMNPLPAELCEHNTSKLNLKVEAGKVNNFNYDLPVAAAMPPMKP